jgi:hypothetical protein
MVGWRPFPVHKMKRRRAGAAQLPHAAARARPGAVSLSACVARPSWRPRQQREAGRKARRPGNFKKGSWLWAGGGGLGVVMRAEECSTGPLSGGSRPHDGATAVTQARARGRARGAHARPAAPRRGGWHGCGRGTAGRALRCGLMGRDSFALVSQCRRWPGAIYGRREADRLAAGRAGGKGLGMPRSKPGWAHRRRGAGAGTIGRACEGLSIDGAGLEFGWAGD